MPKMTVQTRWTKAEGQTAVHSGFTSEELWRAQPVVEAFSGGDSVHEYHRGFGPHQRRNSKMLAPNSVWVNEPDCWTSPKQTDSMFQWDDHKNLKRLELEKVSLQNSCPIFRCQSSFRNQVPQLSSAWILKTNSVILHNWNKIDWEEKYWRKPWENLKWNKGRWIHFIQSWYWYWVLFRNSNLIHLKLNSLQIKRKTNSSDFT